MKIIRFPQGVHTICNLNEKLSEISVSWKWNYSHTWYHTWNPVGIPKVPGETHLENT